MWVAVDNFMAGGAKPEVDPFTSSGVNSEVDEGDISGHLKTGCNLGFGCSWAAGKLAQPGDRTGFEVCWRSIAHRVVGAEADHWWINSRWILLAAQAGMDALVL